MIIGQQQKRALMENPTPGLATVPIEIQQQISGAEIPSTLNMSLLLGKKGGTQKLQVTSTVE